MRKKRTSLIASALVAVIALAGLTAFAVPATSAQAAVASDFDPGNIISDENFFNGNALSAPAVQSFLDARVASCRSGYTCLKDYTQTTWSRSADAMCNAYTGAANETAATIIAKVGQACGVSQAVLIVLLQKEQSLITDTYPSASQYRAATGFACPDTAPCDAEYSGFYNQVYKAAWQYKRYTNPAGTSAFFTWFPVGKYASVRYHPNAACGSSAVLIKNKATAGLYYYTPYQPNATAMSNVYGGQTDGCSSYGNRNFWRLYTDWFGDPRAANNPHGAFDSVNPVAGGVQVTGWAVDASTDKTVSLTVTVDGANPTTVAADQRLDWISVLYPGKSALHGFSAIVGASPGKHSVCVVKSTGVDLGCKSVTVPTSTAAGYLDTAEGVVGGVHIAGWSLNTKSAATGYIWVNVDGRGGAYVVDKKLAWTPVLYPGTGNTHGFDRVITATPGAHTVCVYGYASVLLGCSNVVVPSNEAGAVEKVEGTLGTITVSGWSLDKRTTAPSYVWVDVDGKGKAVYAGGDSAAAAAAWPAGGRKHGFSTTFSASPGSHRVCVTGTVANTSYGCSTVTVPNNEVGSFDTATGVLGGIQVSGWSLDRTSTESTYVWVNIDGKGGALYAGASLGWIDAMFKKGAKHGFSGFFSASAGTHEVCVSGTKEGVSYGCKKVTVPSSGAASWDSVSVADRSIRVTGWATDRLSTAVQNVSVSVDGKAQSYPASTTLGWFDSYFPKAGKNHGFDITIPATAGKHTVCITASYDGQNLGCRDVDVPSSGAASIDSVTGVPGGVRITGWSVDRTSTATTYLWVDVDGKGTAVAANKTLGWIDAYFPGVGTDHGIDQVIPAATGNRRVCITSTFDGRALGCSTVAVP
ncbi:hypothetical protein N1031_14700 [Herbiconiux moechotypicola]|uniref:Hemagglutinin n=1 Tax=Herbiconiux moechotypicola TaxID=637393 RepID=A0ABN3DUX7_9MICO|nr:hypothetical protein [Herbiconiux moechotypicola]MCS5731013.1 hypothetical protein [Herbiconiux moechotypicola]